MFEPKNIIEKSLSGIMYPQASFVRPKTVKSSYSKTSFKDFSGKSSPEKANSFLRLLEPLKISGSISPGINAIFRVLPNSKTPISVTDSYCLLSDFATV